MIFLLYIIGILLFVLSFYFGYIVIIPFVLALSFFSLLLVDSKVFYFWLLSLLIAIRPITIDLFFWDDFIFGFKITHIYSFLLIALCFLAVFKLKVDLKSFNLWIIPVIFFLYHLAYFLNSLLNGNVYGSLEYFLRNAGGVPFFFAIGYILDSEEKFIKFLKIILIPLLILVFFSLVFSFYKIDELYMITGNQKQFWRLKLLYHDSAQLVIYLTMAFIILCYLYIKERKFYYLLFIYLTLIPIYATQTRSAWVSSLAVFLIFLIWIKKPHYLIPFIIFFILNFNSILERWNYAGIEFNEEAGFSGRVGLWKIGLGFFLSYDPIYKIFGQVGNIIAKGDFHNQYISWLVYNGIFGLVFNSLVLILLFIKSFSLTKNPMILMVYAWIMISGFLGNFLSMPNVVVFLWSILGYCLRNYPK
ncbi:MAG: hypothetical protein RQ990_00905 [Candidatus Hydrothermia bacterium]|nr:hypothetical protein [Candidatus Hydrothermia bacterium]